MGGLASCVQMLSRQSTVMAIVAGGVLNGSPAKAVMPGFEWWDAHISKLSILEKW